MAAALVLGDSQIIHPLNADDTRAARNVLRQVGVDIHEEPDRWRVRGGNFQPPAGDLFCGDSAATLRFMTAICSLIPGRCRLVAGPSLARRPVKPLIDALAQLGVDGSCHGEVPPVTIDGGRLKGGITSLPGDISSQYVSALLFISPLAAQEMTIRLTTPLESRPYVMMTLDCLTKFGITVAFTEELDEFEVFPQRYTPAAYTVEGDWSSASYLLALGAVGGKVTVDNLDPQSLQSDRVLLDLLREMGVDININNDSITASQSRLTAIRADLTDCIDLLPTMAVLAAVADGVSRLSGIERARLKESDRVGATVNGLRQMGISVAEDRGSLSITGTRPQGAVIDSRGDHRMAMAFSILGTIAGDTVITDAACVTKTYPQFWDTLCRIGGEVKLDG